MGYYRLALLPDQFVALCYSPAAVTLLVMSLPAEFGPDRILATKGSAAAGPSASSQRSTEKKAVD